MAGRFNIQQERDDEPTYVVDDATDPDKENHEIVTISAHYGTPKSRKLLAQQIKTILEEMANSRDEMKP